MDKATRSKELQLAENALRSGEIYNLSRLAEGSAEVASPFSSTDTREVQQLLAKCVPGSDLEYPPPRQVLRRGYREPFRVGEMNPLMGDPERGAGGAGADLPLKQRRPDEGVAPSGGLGDRGGPVGGPTSVTAAIAGGLAATGLLLLVLAIAGVDGLPFAPTVAIAVFTTAAAVVVWRTGELTGSPQASGETEEKWSDLWALRDGAGLREAIGVGLRTGGLGLLVSPREPAEDETMEIDDSEKASGDLR